MTKRDAKREACRQAGWAINGLMEGGWPFERADLTDNIYSEPDQVRLDAALRELVDELLTRGGV